MVKAGKSKRGSKRKASASASPVPAKKASVVVDDSFFVNLLSKQKKEAETASEASPVPAKEPKDSITVKCCLQMHREGGRNVFMMSKQAGAGCVIVEVTKSTPGFGLLQGAESQFRMVTLTGYDTVTDDTVIRFNDNIPHIILDHEREPSASITLAEAGAADCDLGQLDLKGDLIMLEKNDSASFVFAPKVAFGMPDLSSGEVAGGVVDTTGRQVHTVAVVKASVDDLMGCAPLLDIVHSAMKADRAVIVWNSYKDQYQNNQGRQVHRMRLGQHAWLSFLPHELGALGPQWLPADKAVDTAIRSKLKNQLKIDPVWDVNPIMYGAAEETPAGFVATREGLYFFEVTNVQFLEKGPRCRAACAVRSYGGSFACMYGLKDVNGRKVCNKTHDKYGSHDQSDLETRFVDGNGRIKMTIKSTGKVLKIKGAGHINAGVYGQSCKALFERATAIAAQANVSIDKASALILNHHLSLKDTWNIYYIVGKSGSRRAVTMNSENGLMPYFTDMFTNIPATAVTLQYRP